MPKIIFKPKKSEDKQGKDSMIRFVSENKFSFQILMVFLSLDVPTEEIVSLRRLNINIGLEIGVEPDKAFSPLKMVLKKVVVLVLEWGWLDSTSSSLELLLALSPWLFSSNKRGKVKENPSLGSLSIVRERERIE